jgi:hypothetical protein
MKIQEDKIDLDDTTLITYEQYQNAIAIKLGFEAQQRVVLEMNRPVYSLKRNDYAIYKGDSRGDTTSKHLRVGKKYRLTCSPYGKYIAIINDNGKRMITKATYFMCQTEN